jgi:sulfur dioxygenase
LIVRELNRSKCKSYLLGCARSGAAVLIDPLRDHVDRYLAVVAYERMRLVAVIDTHTHADHRSGCADLGHLTGAPVLMHRNAPSPRVDRHLRGGDLVQVGELTLRIIETPGHTPDGICIQVGDVVFTGDTLMIGGTGRADFAGGDAGAQFDSIVNELFALPDLTRVLPAHDYRGHSESTIGAEKRGNPRLAGRTRSEYVALMANLGLPLPDKVQEVLQPNQTALDDDSLAYPSLAQLNEVSQLAPLALQQMQRDAPPLVIDVREPDEFAGPLGHLAGARSIPLARLAARAAELDAELDANAGRPIIVVCRSGVRSTTAAAILTSLGYEAVANLKGGMLAWSDLGLPVER